jgi:hypothetical protein
MSNERARATGTGLPEKPHSESNPYHMAIYLHSLVKAAAHLVDGYTEATQLDLTGVPELMTVIEERAAALSRELDAGVFCERWPLLRAELDRDGQLLALLGDEMEAAQ